MKELETVSANTLIATPFEPLKMPVQNLIGDGITIIGGSSKCGKSWLMLKLCLAVADGAPFFDMETEQADVLYLCLEDSFRRLQERLFKLTDNDVPENLYIAVSAGIIGNELEDQIRDFKDKHPKLRLIVVDTLQMVREQDPYLNAYADDYKCLTRLKALAESAGLSIVLVHHLRKLGTMYSSGITGSECLSSFAGSALDHADQNSRRPGGDVNEGVRFAPANRPCKHSICVYKTQLARCPCKHGICGYKCRLSG